MKRLPLTFEDRQFLKAVEKNAVVLMLMLRIHPVAVDGESLAYEMKWDRRTADKYLDSLASDQLVGYLKGQGYVLTSETRRLLSSFFIRVKDIVFDAEVLAQSPENNDQAQIEAQAQNHFPAIPPTSTQLEQHKMCTENLTHIVCALKKEEEDSIILIKQDSSTSSELKSGETAQNVHAQVKALTTENILEASAVLFDGKAVVLNGLKMELIRPEYALGCLAHACAESNHLRNPVGLAYNMLKFVGKPRRVYASAPLFYLPNAFKEIFGLAVYDCPFSAECGGIAFTTRTDYEAHMVAVHQFTEGDESAPPELEPMQEIEDGEVLHAWHTVLGLLAAEMPQASFDTWVRDTVAARYDGHTLTVGTRNSYARDWLDSRLKATIERMLAGTAGLGKYATVEFVVMGGEGG